MIERPPGEFPWPSTQAVRPVRVAMVIQRFRPAFSGQGVQLEELSKVLARRDVDVSVITATAGTGCSVEHCAGYCVVRLGSDPPGMLPDVARGRLRGAMFALRVFEYLQTRGRCDVVHVHAMTDALHSSYAWCRWQDRPLLFEMTLLGADDPLTIRQSPNILSGLRNAIFRRCDGYVAISPVLEDTCRRAGLPLDRVRLIPQGVDVGVFETTADKASLRRALGLPERALIVVFVGSLIHRKGIDVLLEVWPRLHAAHPDAQLLLVGRNEFQGDAEATGFLAATVSGLSAAAAAACHQVGVKVDVHRWLQASDLFVFPSRREGFGTVMIEAMACGLPCVVTELPGITDFIFDEGGRTGVVVSQDDPDALFSTMAAILSEPARAKAMGHAARATVLERFDIEKIADRYLACYAELLGRTRVGADA